MKENQPYENVTGVNMANGVIWRKENNGAMKISMKIFCGYQQCQLAAVAISGAGINGGGG
jgi:hypothetical protein